MCSLLWSLCFMDELRHNSGQLFLGFCCCCLGVCLFVCFLQYVQYSLRAMASFGGISTCWSGWVYRDVPREWNECVFQAVSADSDSCSVLRMSSLLTRPTASEETMALACSQFLWVNRSVRMIRIPTLCINNSLKLTWTFKGKIHEISSHWLTVS